MIHASRRRDGKRTVTADASFHNVWIGRSGNSELVRLILQIKVRLRRVELAYSKVPTSELRAYEEHREIIRGIKGGSPGRAVDALKQNWRSATERLYQRAVGPLGLADRTGWL
jgi:DNA-binding GntR family transcriptional regulator